MPSGFFLLRDEWGGGGLIREEGLIKKFNLQTGGLLEGGGGLIRAFTVCTSRILCGQVYKTLYENKRRVRKIVVNWCKRHKKVSVP